MPVTWSVADDLLDTLTAHKDGCVGMAANMIGVNKAIIVFDNEGTPCEMFNPVIVYRKGPYLTEEGCLSLQGQRRARRHRTIKVQWQDRAMQTHVKNSPAGLPRSSSMRWTTATASLYNRYTAMRPRGRIAFFVHMFNPCQNRCNVKMLQYMKNSSALSFFHCSISKIKRCIYIILFLPNIDNAANNSYNRGTASTSLSVEHRFSTHCAGIQNRRYQNDFYRYRSQH